MYNRDSNTNQQENPLKTSNISLETTITAKMKLLVSSFGVPSLLIMPMMGEAFSPLIPSSILSERSFVTYHHISIPFTTPPPPGGVNHFESSSSTLQNHLILDDYTATSGREDHTRTRSFLQQQNATDENISLELTRMRLEEALRGTTTTTASKQPQEMGVTKEQQPQQQETPLPRRGPSCILGVSSSMLTNTQAIDRLSGKILRTRPRAIVCSALGETTRLLQLAGEQAVDKGDFSLVEDIRNQFHNIMNAFDFSTSDRSEIHTLLDECQEYLQALAWVQDLSPKSLDELVSFGHRITSLLLALRLNQLGVPGAKAYNGWDVGMSTDSNFGDATLIPGYESLVQEAFAAMGPDVLPIITGGLGKDQDNGWTTTLGGGCDLTATALAAALGGDVVDEVQLYEEDGIWTADPRTVPTAMPVDQMTYSEALAFASVGGAVTTSTNKNDGSLHPKTLRLAETKNLPLRVMTSFHPEAVGMMIQKEKSTPPEEQSLVTAITYEMDLTAVDVQTKNTSTCWEFLSRVFSKCAKHEVTVDILNSSANHVSLAIDETKQDAYQVAAFLQDLESFADVENRSEHTSILTMVADTDRSSTILTQAYGVFAEEGIQAEMLPESRDHSNLSFLVATKDLEKAVVGLHESFFPPPPCDGAMEPSETCPTSGKTKRQQEKNIGSMMTVVRNAVLHDSDRMFNETKLEIL